MYFLVLIVLVFSGLLLAIETGAPGVEAVSGWPMAAAVIGALAILYMTTLRDIDGRRLPRVLVIAALGLAAGLATEALHRKPPAFLADILASVHRESSADALARNAPASVRIRRNATGGFVVNARVDGAPMEMLIDNGASSVVLRSSDAESAGVDTGSLEFNTPFKTGNGTSYFAATRLKSVRIGPLIVEDVEALVARPGTLNESLLGQSFLTRLASYEVAGNFVTLRR